jgi:hypothetical protein
MFDVFVLLRCLKRPSPARTHPPCKAAAVPATLPCHVPCLSPLRSHTSFLFWPKMLALCRHSHCPSLQAPNTMCLPDTTPLAESGYPTLGWCKPEFHLSILLSCSSAALFVNAIPFYQRLLAVHTSSQSPRKFIPSSFASHTNSTKPVLSHSIVAVSLWPGDTLKTCAIFSAYHGCHFGTQETPPTHSIQSSA